MHIHLHITPNAPGQAILDELLASVELRETLAERLEEHMAAALRDAVYNMLPYRAGIDNCEFDVTVDNDTLPALLLACQAAQDAASILGELGFATPPLGSSSRRWPSTSRSCRSSAVDLSRMLVAF
jgi:hypothetical protein